MGTTMSGRYLNTRGSGRRASDFALVHSNEGDFSFPNGKEKKRRQKKGEKLIRLDGGGHEQKSLDLLKKYGIAFEITKTFSNGVRIGIVPDHTSKKKREKPMQSWFPESWSEKDIQHAGQHVSGLKGNRRVRDGKTIFGVYKGVRVGVIRTNGKIGTIFPDLDQSKVVNKRRKGKKK